MLLKEMVMKMNRITARDNEKIKNCVKLRDSKKYRDESGLFVFEGYKLFCDAVSAKIAFKDIFVTDGAYIKYKNELNSSGALLTVVSESVYEKLTNENAPQGIFCVCEKPRMGESTDGRYIVILDRISDPGNFGTIIRCADAFGASRVIASADSADLYSPKTVRACMGSLFRKNVEVSDSLPDRILSLRASGYTVYAAMLRDDATSLDKIDLSGKSAFVIGNEGSGVSRGGRRACDRALIIPIEKGPQSLNGHQAPCVLCWEAYGK